MPIKINQHQRQPLTVTIDGEEIPKALQTAFLQAGSKKPFSYFSSSNKPDSSAHPSPSAVRRSNPLTNAPNVPRVLPIVSDRDLLFEEQRLKENFNRRSKEQKTSGEDMATLMHAQYNSPMPLYSRDNVRQVLHETEDFLQHRPHSASSGQFNPTSLHSARLDDQKDEYPHYRGFVDPRVQSPSFKRLQYVTGMDSGAEDEISHELRPGARSRSGEPRSRTESRQSGGSQHEPQEFKPQWSDEMVGPRVGQRDPTAESDQEQTYDPTFAARIAEAERPKVPPPTVPSWTRKAEEKQRKWQQYGDKYQPRAYEYHPPQANWQPDAQKVRDKWGSYHGTSGRDSRGGYRATSAEPYSRRLRQPEREIGGRKEWLKPNVANSTFAPPPQKSYSPLTSSRYNPIVESQECGNYYSSSERPYSSVSTTSSVHQRSTSPYNYKPYAHDSSSATYNYGRSDNYNPQRKEVNVSTLVSGEALKPNPQPPTVPPWSKHAEYKRTVWESKRTSVDPDYQQRPVSGEPPPPWTQKAEQTHSLWQNEADAWRQRQGGESNLKPRATSTGPADSGYGSRSVSERRYESSQRSTPSWHQRPVPHEVTTYTGPSSQRWQPAPGGETKTQSSGSYYDRDGSHVSFTKEAYTSSDPGKDYSMLTEQEKKILEEPLQPGVLSRHVTTKYYKRSTCTTKTTTSTSQTPPVTTTITRHHPETTPSRFTRGVSEY